MTFSGQPDSLVARIAYWTLVAIAAALVVVSFVPWIVRSDWWLIRVFDFPRVQIFVGCLIVALGLVPFVSLKHQLAAANVACLGAIASAVLQGSYILPYLPGAAKQVYDDTPDAAGPTVTLFLANVLMQHHDPAPLRSQIERAHADIVLLTEPDRWWLTHLSPLDSLYPYRVQVPLDNTYGMLLYSRLPLISPEVKYLIDHDTPSIHTAIELDGQHVALRFTHPKPPAPDEATHTTDRNGELLLVASAVQREGGGPSLVAGDLNTVPWSQTAKLLQRTAGLLDPRRGRGLYPTYPAGRPLLRWPLDQIFLSPQFRLVSLKRLGDNGSDHFPLLVTLRLTPASPVQSIPDLNPGDRRKARQAIEDARSE